MKKFLFLLTFLLFIQGCAYQKFNISGRNTIPAYEGLQHYAFWGLAQTRSVNPEEVCGVDGVSGIETGYSFFNFLIDFWTLGIYTTRTYKIYCDAGNSRQYINYY